MRQQKISNVRYWRLRYAFARHVQRAISYIVVSGSLFKILKAK